jgi:hypothetical protein
MKYTNQKLNEFRAVPIKTLEEQKAFLDVKYPLWQKWKFSWKGTFRIIFTLFITIVLFKCYNYVFILYNINITLWQVIIIILIVPLLINYILGKFNLEQNDLGFLLKWK